MLTLIENGEIYAPDARGVQSVLIAFDKILRIGDVDRRAVESLKIELDCVDASGGGVAPGLIDPHEQGLPKWLKFYLDTGGSPEKLTVSTDASITSPRNLFEQIRLCVLEHRYPLEQMLALATKTPPRF